MLVDLLHLEGLWSGSSGSPDYPRVTDSDRLVDKVPRDGVDKAALDKGYCNPQDPDWPVGFHFSCSTLHRLPPPPSCSFTPRSSIIYASPVCPWFVRKTFMMRPLGIPMLGDNIKTKLGTSLTLLIPRCGITSGTVSFRRLHASSSLFIYLLAI
ncbi:hypothetical protein J6590_033157 [Homalodisca vitripennis]|nr:hypothetical protein J6590_033157 [Homalodisca vitripennis]